MPSRSCPDDFHRSEQFAEGAGVVTICVGHADFGKQSEFCFHIVLFKVSVGSRGVPSLE